MKKFNFTKDADELRRVQQEVSVGKLSLMNADDYKELIKNVGWEKVLLHVNNKKPIDMAKSMKHQFIIWWGEDIELFFDWYAIRYGDAYAMTFDMSSSNDVIRYGLAIEVLRTDALLQNVSFNTYVKKFLSSWK